MLLSGDVRTVAQKKGDFTMDEIAPSAASADTLDLVSTQCIFRMLLLLLLLFFCFGRHDLQVNGKYVKWIKSLEIKQDYEFRCRWHFKLLVEVPLEKAKPQTKRWMSTLHYRTKQNDYALQRPVYDTILK